MDEDEREGEHGEEGRISALDLVATSARVLGSSFVPFALITLLVMAPGYVATISLGEWASGEAGAVDPTTLFWASLGTGALRTVLTFVAQATMVHGTVERLAGRPASLRGSLAAALGRTGPLLALAMIQSLAIWLALLACVVPGAVLLCVLFVSIPAAVVERRGPLEAMQRSADLTRGHRLTIFAVALPVLVIAVAARYGLSAALPLLAPLELPLRIADLVVQGVIAALFTMFQAVLAAVFYARARRIHDGLDADAIAKVFE